MINVSGVSITNSIFTGSPTVVKKSLSFYWHVFVGVFSDSFFADYLDFVDRFGGRNEGVEGED